MSTSIKLDDEIKSRIQNIANIKERTPHWLMRKAITDFVEREEAKEAFKQEAISSWIDYKETGKHVTGDELNHWLDSWGTNEANNLPKCHK